VKTLCVGPSCGNTGSQSSVLGLPSNPATNNPTMKLFALFASLVQATVYLVTPNDGAPDSALSDFKNAIESLGATVLEEYDTLQILKIKIDDNVDFKSSIDSLILDDVTIEADGVVGIQPVGPTTD
jgi:hypothetical protein